MNASNSPYDHKMSPYVLLKPDKTVKQMKLDVSLCVVNMHTVFSLQFCIRRGIVTDVNFNTSIYEEQKKIISTLVFFSIYLHKCRPPSMWRTKNHTHVKQQENLWLCISIFILAEILLLTNGDSIMKLNVPLGLSMNLHLPLSLNLLQYLFLWMIVLTVGRRTWDFLFLLSLDLQIYHSLPCILMVWCLGRGAILSFWIVLHTNVCW